MALSYEDKREIEELLSKYAWWIDSFMPVEAFYDIFTEDAVLTSPVSGRFEGCTAHEEFVRYRSTHPSWGDGRNEQMRHAIVNPLIEGDGDRAFVRAILLDFTTPTEPDSSRTSQFMLTGHYECEAVRVDGAWKLKSRYLVLDPISGGAHDNSRLDYRAVGEEQMKAAATSSNPAGTRVSEEA